MTRLLIASLSALATSACVIAPYPHGRAGNYNPPVAYPGEQESSGAVYADVPPPPLYAEVIPVMPFFGALWLGGYWGWGGGRHHWVPGRWEQPRAGYEWRPHAWQQEGGRWRQRDGAWYQR